MRVGRRRRVGWLSRSKSVRFVARGLERSGVDSVTSKEDPPRRRGERGGRRRRGIAQRSRRREERKERNLIGFLLCELCAFAIFARIRILWGEVVRAGSSGVDLQV